MTTNYLTDDPIFGQVDLDDKFITDAWLVDRYVGSAMWAWGKNTNGQLGLNNTTHRSSPVQFGSLLTWRKVEGLEDAAAALRTDGTLWMWGANVYGALGQNNTTTRSSPVQVGTLTSWKDVAGGSNFVAAVRDNGTLWVWGRGDYGQIGNNSIAHRSSPVQVGTGTDWKQVACGNFHCMAIKQDGTLWGWGRNHLGQVGPTFFDGTIVDRSSPVQIGSLTDWKQVACCGNSTAAIRLDGTLWTWGDNARGQLGIGTVAHRSSPTQVGTLTNWKSIGFQSDGMAAITADGKLWTWGLNDQGQLGLSDRVHRSSPVQVGSLTNWKQVATLQNTKSLLAVKTDGTLWAWGENSSGSGQLGLNDTVHRSSPVQIGSLTNWKYVGGNFNSGFAIQYTE
jgi:alpha-tubulin suppressor-like RCC1 family protein